MKLNNILKHKGITIQELSKKTGINYHTLQKYSSCTREPSVKNAKILGKFLRVNWWEFFKDN
ncbi:helix-turn-helix transcriptional regulator [Lachnospiraceae bacterium 46-61]